MNSSITSISEFLTNAQSITTAGFSAGYNFYKINAAEYFDELIENSNSSEPIFSGILIIEKSENNIRIIDGLQRITTINLLLCALCESYKNTSEKNEGAKNKILTRYLTAKNEPKLKLIRKDQRVYKKILLGGELNKIEKESNLVKTYKTFLEKINERKISGTEIFQIISRIQFMIITTDKLEISARELYQSLNGNKNDSQVNLISDFIIQKDEAAAIKWLKIIKSLKSSGYQNLCEEFIKDFLTIQNDGKIPNKNALYSTFKSYFGKLSKYQASDKIIKNVCNYAKNYFKIVNADFENAEIKEQIIILNENQGQDSYPYLMEVLEDLESGHINKEIFLDILIMINSFIKNRQENLDSEVNINFSGLSKELNKMLVLKDYTPEIIEENKFTINEINNLATFEV